MALSPPFGLSLDSRPWQLTVRSPVERNRSIPGLPAIQKLAANRTASSSVELGSIVIYTFEMVILSGSPPWTHFELFAACPPPAIRAIFQQTQTRTGP